ncbi:MAG: YunC family protein [bacterium]
MIQKKIRLTRKEAESYVIPFGKFNMVAVVTDIGMIGCGMFDVLALDKFDYPAARLKSDTGGLIDNVDDLLRGIVKDANKAAQNRGIEIGMTGAQALDLL